ncbi:ABC transporter ATP-binding protein [Halovulum sp. GXIMD14794]
MTVLGLTLRAALRHRTPLVLTVAIVGVQILIALAVPWPLKLVVDNVLGNEPLPGALSVIAPIVGPGHVALALGFLCIAFVVLHSLRQLSQFARNYVMARVEGLLRMDMAAELLRHLQNISVMFFAKERVGDLTQRLTEDSRFAADLISLVFLPALTSLGTLIAMLVVLSALSPTLALVALCTAAPVPFVVLYFRKQISDRSFEQQESFGDVMAEAERSITSIQVVQAFNREDDGNRRFRSQTERAVKAVLRATSVQLSFDFALGAINALGTAAGLVVGGLLVLEGQATVGTLLIALSYLQAVMGPVGELAAVAAAYGTAVGKGRRVVDILDREVDVQDRPNAVPLAATLPGTGHSFRFDNVHFSYSDGSPVIEGASFQIAAGETVALVGPTGAGKSTLAALLMRLADPTCGRILIDGTDLRDVALRSLREAFSVVLQDSFLLPISVADNIRLSKPDATPQQVEQAARMAQAHDFISDLPDGYETVIGEQGATLSGGQKQRISFARAMLRQAPVLILDEPSSALDVETEAAMFDALAEHCKGRTVVLIAHRPATLRVADRILQLKDGRISELAQRDGPPAESPGGAARNP